MIKVLVLGVLHIIIVFGWLFCFKLAIETFFSIYELTVEKENND